MPGTLTLTGMAAGLASGEQIFPGATMTGVSQVGYLNATTLTTGDNTFQVPSGVTPVACAVFIGSGGVAATVKARTNLNSADAGLRIAPFSGVGFAVFPLPAGTTSVVLNASGSVSNVAVVFI